MTIDKIFVAIFSIAGILFTYWFFLMKKEEVVSVEDDNVDITVDGGYIPSTIALPKGKQTTIHFLRKDPSSCLEEVVLGEFSIRKFLPLNKETAITITPRKEGVFPFSCGMNMFHGKIIVK